MLCAPPQAGLLQMVEATPSSKLPWAETLVTMSVPLQLENVHDDLQR
jgi:hypothetical protein